MSEAQSEADNEVCRHIFRKRASIVIGKTDPFHDWAIEFFVDGTRYAIGRRTSNYGWIYSFFTENDPGSGPTWFRPSRHLLETLWTVIEDTGVRQRQRQKARITNNILGAQ